METLKVFESFAGYGGASFGLQKAHIPFEVVVYSEIDSDAITIYEHNFPGIKNYGDITKIDESTLPDFDLFTGGFPCQPFSSVGKVRGELDIRGTLFGDIIRICKVKLPKYILLENVKGLISKRHKSTLQKIISELNTIGYDVRYTLLNSKDYGVPQNRERVWIFAYLGQLPEIFDLIPPKIELEYHIKDFLDSEPDVELYRTQKQIDRIKELHNVTRFEVDEPLCYDYYNRKLRTDGICPTVTPP